MNVLQRTKRIAKNVRKWTEEAHECGDIVAGHDDLCGYCAIASYELFKRLKRAKIKVKIAGNSHHVFVIVRNHIVDVTATQFDEYEEEPILINHLDEMRTNSSWDHKIEWKCKNKQQFIKVMKRWPMEQTHPELIDGGLLWKKPI